MSLCTALKTSHNPLIHYLASLGGGTGIGNLAISGQMSNLIALPTSCGARAYMMKLTLVAERQDVLKQFQNEVNDIRSERLARSTNPLALLAAAQPYSDNYYQAPKPQRSNAPSYTQSH
ncbi:hypothetical protein Tco_0148227 [Tanacetum coccineum]